MEETAATKELKQMFTQIRDERRMYANTSSRIGNAFLSLLSYLDSFLKKDGDTASGLITFLKGIGLGENCSIDELGNALLNNITSPNFSEGPFGSGFTLKKDSNGDSYIEVDRGLFRKSATFVELLIQKLQGIGGQLLVTPAQMHCIKVTEQSDSYRCFFKNAEDEKTISNDFVVNDLVRSQTFNKKGGSSYYWRKVLAVGDDYIDLSKTDCDVGSTVPLSGDDIIQLGNTSDATRQAALFLSAYGDDAPCFKFYKGINSYDLSGKEFVDISRKEIMMIADNFRFSTGESVKDYVDGKDTGARSYTDSQIAANNNGVILRVSSVEKKANDAQNTADTAVSNASTAQKTADGKASPKDVADAKSAAINTAATDATTKASAVQSNAVDSSKTYTDGQIKVVSDEISSKVSKTDYDSNNKAIQSQFTEYKQTADSISLTVNDVSSAVSKAQTTANTAVSNAAAAQKIADGKASPTDVSNAKSAAISAAATDATSKADGALSSAKNYANVAAANGNAAYKQVNWQTISAATDLNSMTTTGKYLMTGTLTNSATTAWAYLVVEYASSGRITQTIWHDTDATNKYTRQLYNTTWGSWLKMANATDVNTVSSKADSAISTANNASSAATNASTKANTAQTTANNAASTALTANSTANSANSKADTINTGLTKTGIDITSHVITATANNFKIKNNSGAVTFSVDSAGNIVGTGNAQFNGKVVATTFNTVNNTFVVDSAGNITCNGGTFNNIKVNGSIRSPFTFSEDSLNTEYTDNVSLFGVQESSYTMYQLPWDVSQNGRHITLINYKSDQNGVSHISRGRINIGAPSGKYFFENGEAKNTLIFSREIVELVGYGDSNTFYGWIVLGRTDLMPNHVYGKSLKALAMGQVNFNDYDNVTINAVDFTGSSDFRVTRPGEAYFHVTMPSTILVNDYTDYMIFLTGIGMCFKRNWDPVKATLWAKGSENGLAYFDVITSDGGANRDGSFEFMVINPNDFVY